MSELRRTFKNFSSLKKKLKEDKDIIIAMLNKDGFILKEMSEEYQNNEDLVIYALKTSGIEVLDILGLRNWLNGKDFVGKAIKKCPQVYHFLPEGLKKNQEIIKNLLSTRLGIKEAGELLTSKDFVLFAIRKVGVMVLEYLDDSLKNDIDIIKEAIINGPIYNIYSNMIGLKLKGNEELFSLAIENAE